MTTEILKSPSGQYYRCARLGGFRRIFGVLIPSGLRVFKLDLEESCWIYLDTLPDYEAFKSLVKNSK